MVGILFDYTTALAKYMTMRITFFIAFCCSIISLSAQKNQVSGNVEDWNKDGLYVTRSIVVDGDTLPVVMLREAKIEGTPVFSRSDFARIKRNVIRVYPYVKVTLATLDQIDTNLSKFSKRRFEKKYLRWAEGELKDEFSRELKKLTYSQGRTLIKLINRETGVTTYDIIKDLKNGFSAMIWQGVAKLFDSDLKAKYNPTAEDYVIEYVVSKIESGEYPVQKREMIDISEAQFFLAHQSN